jgi:hypothetical protein
VVSSARLLRFRQRDHLRTAARLGYPYGAYPYCAGYTAYQAGYADECYLVRRRVLTRYGWRWRSVQICN